MDLDYVPFSYIKPSAICRGLWKVQIWCEQMIVTFSQHSMEYIKTRGMFSFDSYNCVTVWGLIRFRVDVVFMAGVSSNNSCFTLIFIFVFQFATSGNSEPLDFYFLTASSNDVNKNALILLLSERMISCRRYWHIPSFFQPWCDWIARGTGTRQRSLVLRPPWWLGTVRTSQWKRPDLSSKTAQIDKIFLLLSWNWALTISI